MVTRRAGRPTKRFRARGERLWKAHKDQVDGERGLVLLEEACRIADRLDQLDRLLKGDVDAWARIVASRTGEVEVRIDAALIEARQQANVLRQIVAGLPLKEAHDGDDAGAWIDGVSNLQP